jgi:hypothetical protein
MDEWIHLQVDVYPAYITWEQYLANQERLHQNEMRFASQIEQAQGAARHGMALLQGLAVCGYCGCHMWSGYKHSSHNYFCDALNKRYGEPSCVYIPGPPVDEVVVQAFLDAIRPAQLDALEAVLAAQQAERERLTRQWEEQLKQARYEARLAERQYNAVDPDNRLVATELERRWEEKLRQLQSTQESYDRFLQVSTLPGLSPELRVQFQLISETLPDLWRSGQLSNQQKKELLRSLISKVILKRKTPDTVEVKIVWVSGHYTVVYARVLINRQQDLPRYDELVERIRELWQQGRNDQQIADQMTAEGFHTARSQGVSPVTVQKIRLAHDWHLSLHRSRNALELDGYLTPRGLAARLGVERTWVYRRIYNREIDPAYISRHPQSNVHLIRDDPELLTQLRQMVSRKPHAEGGI